MAAAQFCTKPRRRLKTSRGKHSKFAAFEGVVRLVDWAEMVGSSERRMRKRWDGRFILMIVESEAQKRRL